VNRPAPGADAAPSTGASRPVTAPSRPDQELRNRLLAAGQRVFAETGYAGTRVDDVIEAANTSRATFYRYFKSKNALFSELSRLCFIDLRVVTRAIGSLTPGDGARGQLIELLQQWRELFEHHGGVIRAWFERDAVADSPLSKEAAKAFDSLFEELLGPITAADTGSRVHPEVQAALLFILIDRSYYYVTSRQSHVNPDRLAPTLATMIERSYLGAGAPAQGRRLRIAHD
jgi:AcrR family transcriptional regulator